MGRRQTSNDNPFSDAHFKALKYQPEFPRRFESIDKARTDCVPRRGVAGHRSGMVARLLNEKDQRCRQPVIAARRFTRPARGWIRLLASQSAHQWHPAPRQPRPPDRPVWDIRHPSARLSANLAVRGASSPPIGFRSDPSSWLFLSGNGSAPRGYTPIHVNRGAIGLRKNRRLPVPKLGPRLCAYHSTNQCADPDHDHVTGLVRPDRAIAAGRPCWLPHVGARFEQKA